MTARKMSASRKTVGRPRGYIPHYNPHAKTLALLDAVKTVLNEYREYLPLTVRQVFYRLIGAYGYEKTEAFYGNLCGHLAKARRGGVIPFSAIRDDGVVIAHKTCFEDEDDFLWHIRHQAKNYRRDLMVTQPRHIEIWCEAAGMIQQLANVADRYSIPVRSSSGFDSLTAKKDIADRIIASGKPAVVLHLGDHDKSGENIYRSAAEDVGAFVAADRFSALVTVEFRRVALTADQVRDYDLPTAPPKRSDGLGKAWRGETCQLEALTPRQIADILDDAIRDCLDLEQLEGDRADEYDERDRLTRLLLTGPEVSA